MTTPTLRTWNVQERDGTVVEFHGILLGVGTSSQDYHQHVELHAPRGVRCSACRWFEVTIYRTPDDDEDNARYIVHTVGRSAVPRESDRHSVTHTDSSDEIIEVLTQRGHGSEPTLPSPSARALAQAAKYDADIREAYRERRVA